MTGNVLDQLRQKRNRTSVPVREDQLIPEKNILKIEVNSSAEIKDSNTKDPETSNKSNTLKELESELLLIPKTVRHSAIVLEESIDRNLSAFCKENKITIELFLESAWTYSQTNSSALESILNEAKQRYQNRKRAGKLKRLITMLKDK